jgi:hypothetical protein
MGPFLSQRRGEDRLHYSLAAIKSKRAKVMPLPVQPLLPIGIGKKKYA